VFELTKTGALESPGTGLHAISVVTAEVHVKGRVRSDRAADL
jgi:hypothetical protein